MHKNPEKHLALRDGQVQNMLTHMLRRFLLSSRLYCRPWDHTRSALLLQRSRALPPVGTFTLPRRSFKWLVLFFCQTKTACAFIIAQADGCVNMRIVPVVFELRGDGVSFPFGLGELFRRNRRFRERRVEVFRAAAREVSDGQGLTPPLHPRKGHSPLDPFFRALY